MTSAKRLASCLFPYVKNPVSSEVISDPKCKSDNVNIRDLLTLFLDSGIL